MEKKMIKACIFDLDGTLLDTITTITYYVNLILRREGLGEITEDECKYFAGNGAKKLIERSLSKFGIDDEEIFLRVLSDYMDAYNEAPLYLTRPYDGIPELVEGLRGAGVRLAVLSNKPDEAVGDIIDSFFKGSFEIVRGGRDGVPLKPDPAAVFDILAEMGIDRDEALYVGDTNVDMLTGRAAGAHKTIGVSWGFRKVDELLGAGADIIVHHPSEILEEALS